MMYKIIILTVLIIFHVFEIKPQDYYGGSDYGDDYGDDYGSDYDSDYGSVERSYRQSSNQWASLAPALEKIGKCSLDCVVSFIKTPECREIFPCSYFCFIDNVKAMSRYHAYRRKRSIVNYQSRASNQPAFNLREIQKALMCVYHCAKKVDIQNWTTLTEVMYCVVDVCLCYQK